MLNNIITRGLVLLPTVLNYDIDCIKCNQSYGGFVDERSECEMRAVKEIIIFIHVALNLLLDTNL